METIKLTAYSKGSGCGCKIAPAVLSEILKSADQFPTDPRLLVGNESHDDASVIDLGNSECLISTTDFFMPIVDDPYLFGKIAASNALSDVYAMGGKPLTALAILGWPVEKLAPELAQQVLEGARFICRMSGITLAGGHSIESQEPIFGLAVNGLVAKNNIKKNNTAKEGDLIFLTKPLGNGIVTTAAKRGVVKESDYATCISYMTSLNKIGEELGLLDGVHAMTDITGFGLAGHLIEMSEGSELTAEINFKDVPVYPFLGSYLDQFIYPDMTTKNYSFYASRMNTLDAKQLFTLCDPQTSGGLLIALDEKSLPSYLSLCSAHGLPDMLMKPIGKFVSRAEKSIQVNP